MPPCLGLCISSGVDCPGLHRFPPHTESLGGGWIVGGLEYECGAGSELPSDGPCSSSSARVLNDTEQWGALLVLHCTVERCIYSMDTHHLHISCPLAHHARFGDEDVNMI